MLNTRIRFGLANRYFGERVALYVLTLALCLVACRETTVADEVTLQTGERDVASNEPFCLELVSSRSKVLLGEPVRLIVSLRNCSSETQAESDLLAPEFGLLSVWVQRPGTAKEELYSPPIRRNGRGRPSIELAPGDSLDAELPIYFGSGGWVLDREGTYRIRAEYPIGKKYIQSETVELEVSAGDDPEILAAAHAFMQPNASRFYFLTGGDEKGEYELQQIVQAYPDSIPATYSRLAIILNQVLSVEGASRRAPCRQLHDDASYTLASIPDVVTALKGYKVLVDCLIDAGQYDTAESTKDQYYKQFPQAVDLQALWIDGKEKGGGG